MAKCLNCGMDTSSTMCEVCAEESEKLYLQADQIEMEIKDRNELKSWNDIHDNEETVILPALI